MALSSNLELKAKFIAKNLVLCDEDEIASEPFMIVGTDAVEILV